jgi:hypothetical protein
MKVINMPTIYTIDELISKFKESGHPLSPAEIESAKKTLIDFKSPKIKFFSGIMLSPDTQFQAERMQMDYTRGMVRGDYLQLEQILKHLQTKLRQAVLGAIRGQTYETAKLEQYTGERNERSRERLSFLKQDMLPEIDNLIPIFKNAIPISKRTYVTLGGEIDATRSGHDDANGKKPMNPLYVDLAGTDLDRYAQLYATAYVSAREKVGAKRKMTRRKRHTKKTHRRLRK